MKNIKDSICLLEVDWKFEPTVLEENKIDRK